MILLLLLLTVIWVPHPKIKVVVVLWCATRSQYNEVFLWPLSDRHMVTTLWNYHDHYIVITTKWCQKEVTWWLLDDRHLETLLGIIISAALWRHLVTSFLTTLEDSSQSNSHGDLTMESLNDGHMRFRMWLHRNVT